MKVIGITGGTGAGKTTALKVLERMGAQIVDCDALYYEMLENCDEMLNNIHQRFPEAFDGDRLERKKLGTIVFANETALKDLNLITHKHIGNRISQLMFESEASGGNVFVIDAIAVIESGLNEKCDFVIGITAPRLTRAERLIKRENISIEYALMRIDAQQPDSFYEENCDYILVNDSTPEEFEIKCTNLFQNIINIKE